MPKLRINASKRLGNQLMRTERMAFDEELPGIMPWFKNLKKVIKIP